MLDVCYFVSPADQYVSGVDYISKFARVCTYKDSHWKSSCWFWDRRSLGVARSVRTLLLLMSGDKLRPCSHCVPWDPADVSFVSPFSVIACTLVAAQTIWSLPVVQHCHLYCRILFMKVEVIYQIACHFMRWFGVCAGRVKRKNQKKAQQGGGGDDDED